METVKNLIQYVARGFCDIRGILVLDALLMHSVLTDDELSGLLGIQRKDLRAVCARLKEDHLLTDYIQKEEGPGQRAISKTYYYIHYTETIDAIKWKMHSIVSKLNEQMGNEAQPQGYVCDTCKSRYTTIEAVSMFSPDRNGFVCDLCGSMLREDDSNTQSQVNQDRQGMLMTQIRPIIDALKHIDDIVVPENTFQSSLAQAIAPPAQSDVPGAPVNVRNQLNSGARDSSLSQDQSIPVAKSRPGDLNGAHLKVNITSSQETAEQERQLKEQRNRLAEENALPAWHVESTVGKSLTDRTGPEPGTTQVKKEEPEDVKPDISADNGALTDAAKTEEDKANEEALAAYYAALAKQQQEEDDEEEEEDDDEEEEEFEDVGIPQGNNGGVNIEEAELEEEDDDED
uniref:ARAD1C18458p n=1 Tax=Blastobotrys adeninivorans TaxID=409370 RepID=A0A060T761_BLAAD